MKIKHLIDMLKLDEHHGQSELIDIAKGKYKIETTIKGIYKQKIRQWRRKK
jgi:hypothetical protein